MHPTGSRRSCVRRRARDRTAFRPPRSAARGCDEAEQLSRPCRATRVRLQGELLVLALECVCEGGGSAVAGGEHEQDATAEERPPAFSGGQATVGEAGSAGGNRAETERLRGGELECERAGGTAAGERDTTTAGAGERRCEYLPRESAAVRGRPQRLCRAEGALVRPARRRRAQRRCSALAWACRRGSAACSRRGRRGRERAGRAGPH